MGLKINVPFVVTDYIRYYKIVAASFLLKHAYILLPFLVLEDQHLTIVHHRRGICSNACDGDDNPCIVTKELLCKLLENAKTCTIDDYLYLQ